MRINDYFDHVFCVNLDRRSDKWSESVAEFAKHGIDAIRFAAIDGTTLPPPPRGLNAAEVGCSLSHATILHRMVDEGWPRVLVLEDDVEFADGAQDWFAAHVGEVPADWDMLYLGGNHISPPVPVSEHVGRLVRTFTTSHYGITLEMARLVLDEIKCARRQVDVVYADFQPRHRCYVFRPSLAWQRPGFSDIQNGFRDYTPAMKK